MQTYVFTHDDVLILLKGFSLIVVALAVVAPTVLHFLNRWIDLLFDGFQVRMRLARSKNPRFVLDSYRCWVTYRHTWSSRKRYGRFEP